MSATCCLSGYVQIDELAGTTGYRRHQPWCVRSYLTGNLHREVPLKFPVRLFHTSHLPFTRCPPCCCQLCTPWHRTYTHTVKHRPTAGRLRDRWGEHTRKGRSLGGVWVNDRSWLVNPARCPLALREEQSEPHVAEFTRRESGVVDDARPAAEKVSLPLVAASPPPLPAIAEKGGNRKCSVL